MLVITDGGRADAGYTGTTGDCATRSIAVAVGRPYRMVYDELHVRQRAHVDTLGLPARRRSPRLGVSDGVWQRYLLELGWHQATALTSRPRLHSDDLPAGRLVVELSSHLTAVIDGVVHDAFDPRIGAAVVRSVWTGPVNDTPLDQPWAEPLF